MSAQAFRQAAKEIGGKEIFSLICILTDLIRHVRSLSVRTSELNILGWKAQFK